MQTNIHFWPYLAHFFLEWETFQTKVLKNIKTHIFRSIKIFRKYCLLWDSVEKYWRAGKATGDKMTHARCMLNTKLQTAFPLQQLLHERTSVVRYKHIVCLFHTLYEYQNKQQLAISLHK